MNTEMKEYKVIFDESSPCWMDDKEYNRHMVRMQQNYCNELLKARGHLLLSDVYDKLGIPVTDKNVYGAGWVFSLNDHDMNIVDFHIGEEMDGDNFVLKFKVYDNIINILRA